MVTAGNIIGYVRENELFKNHRVMIPPKVRGRIRRISAPGSYTVSDTIMELENTKNPSRPIKIKMSHFWPVRKPRPVLEKLSGDMPLLTG